MSRYETLGKFGEHSARVEQPWQFFRALQTSPVNQLGSFSNDDGDGNEDVKKSIGLDWQNNDSARASCFFVHFFTVLARLRRANA